MQPCEQKETILRIQDRLCTLEDLRVKQAEIAGDISHVKTRIDNGMSHTIKETNDTLKTLVPIIQHHADIVKRIEDLGWLISRVALSTLLVIFVGLVFWAVKNGFIPKL